MNTAAPFRVDIDERLERDILVSKNRLHWILRHLIANAYGGCGTGPDASVLVSARLSATGRRTGGGGRGGEHGRRAHAGRTDAALRTHRQGRDSHTRRWGGHGLGLRHVAAMLKLLDCPPLVLVALGNTVTAASPSPTARTRRLLALPPTRARAARRAAENVLGADRGLRVLVVDDEELIRMVSVASLESQLGDVVTAENGEQGVASYLEHASGDDGSGFDLIPMDIQMPVLSGDLAVKQHPRAPARLAALVHPRALGEHLRRRPGYYKECGMDGCLPKAGNVARQVTVALEAKRKAPGHFFRPDVSLMM